LPTIIAFGHAYLSAAFSSLLSASAPSSEARNFGPQLDVLEVEPIDDVALFAVDL
jgi:hypothetical protein